jgi:hypothetical protein
MGRSLSRPMAHSFDWYSLQLARHPVRTKALTAMTCFGVGETIGQLIVKGKIDLGSLTFMTLFGLCYVGPAGHYWYEGLDTVVVGRMGMRGAPAIAVKLLLDQLLWTPFNTILLFTSVRLWRGNSIQKSLAGALPLLWPTLRVNWIVWPPILVVTFNAIPLAFQPPFLNLCNLLWAIFLSIAKG